MTQLGPLGERAPDETYWAEQIALAASESERVLGFAVTHPSAVQGRLSFEDLGENLMFLGIVGFIDPPEATRSPPSPNVALLALR